MKRLLMALVLPLIVLPQTASAYYLFPGWAWSPGSSIAMALQLGPTPYVFSDGNASFDTLATYAMQRWNGLIRNARFVPQTAPGAPIGDDNGINNVLFWDDPTLYGSALALTLHQTLDGYRVEGDILFNPRVAWDSYRGPVRFVSGMPVFDFYRVVLHELGHELGLGHPNEIGQSVLSLMNAALYPDIDSVWPDDIAGVQALYGRPAAQPATRGADFNSDGHTDIVWSNGCTGEHVIWNLNRAQYGGYTSLPSVDPDALWVIAGTGDFDGDGHTDLLWRSLTTGEVGLWLMQGTQAREYSPLPTVPDPYWQIGGAGDFNGDGMPDIVWRNYTTGQVGIWLMNRQHVTSYAPLPSVPDPSWNIAGVADFDGDGRTDLLWVRNHGYFGDPSDNDLAMWSLDGTHVLHSLVLGTFPQYWHIAGTGDFNEDGNIDILWEGKGGETGVWLMDHVYYAAWKSLPGVGTTAGVPCWVAGREGSG